MAKEIIKTEFVFRDFLLDISGFFLIVLFLRSFHKGNNVSHANNKTKRRFLPNLQYRRFWVEGENRWVRLRISNAALRLIDKVGIEQVVADLRARGEI